MLSCHILVEEGRACPFPISRHLGLWLIAPVILAVNSFWLAPGFYLASTKGASDFAFSHSGGGLKGVLKRIGEIVWIEGAIQPLLLGLAPSGLMVLGRRNLVAATGLGGFLVVGLRMGLPGRSLSKSRCAPARSAYLCLLLGGRYRRRDWAGTIGCSRGSRSARSVRLGWLVRSCPCSS